MSINPSEQILAISSGGGHWVQLLRLRPALRDYNIIFATVDSHHRKDVPDSEFHTIPDSSLSMKTSLLPCLLKIAILIVRIRPKAIISTGAAPGVIALGLGCLFGSRTVWIDSIANTQRLSIAGKIAQNFADIHITQWPRLKSSKRTNYIGNVLCYS